MYRKLYHTMYYLYSLNKKRKMKSSQYNLLFLLVCTYRLYNIYIIFIFTNPNTLIGFHEANF